ncbi:MAG: TetR/AcrR family transcriptional regulator [Bacteroidales bacterium]
MVRKSTREIIIGVAAGLFATIGLRRTTMEVIATAAGRGRRTIYMYFGNKSEIYEAVVDSEINRITKSLRDVTSSEISFKLLLRNYTKERIKLLSDLAGRNPLLIKDFTMGLSRIEKLRERLLGEELKILTPLFRSHIQELNLSGATTPDDYTFIFLNMLRGSDRLLTHENGYIKDTHLSLAAADLFIKGLGCS